MGAQGGRDNQEGWSSLPTASLSIVGRLVLFGRALGFSPSQAEPPTWPPLQPGWETAEGSIGEAACGT